MTTPESIKEETNMDSHDHMIYSIPFETKHGLRMSLNFELPDPDLDKFESVFYIMHNDTTIVGSVKVQKVNTILDVLSIIFGIPKSSSYKSFDCMKKDESMKSYIESDMYINLKTLNRGMVYLWDVLVGSDMQEIFKRCSTYKIHTQLNYKSIHRVNYIVETYDSITGSEEIKNKILVQLVKNISKTSNDQYYLQWCIDIVNKIFYNHENAYGYILPDTNKTILPIHTIKIIKPILDTYF